MSGEQVSRQMTIVITMAGLGRRFRDAGYTQPKYRIRVRGKSLFEWSMESLAGFFDGNHAYIFIVRSEDGSRDFIREKCARMGITNVRVLELNEPTDGQATTAMLAAPYWDRDGGLLIYNIDTYVEAGRMNESQIEGDGFLPCFQAPGEHWSFVRVGEDGRALEVREKKRISDNCTVGAYYFKTCALYEELYKGYYGTGGHMEKGEKYVAPLYNYLIERGGDVRISLIDGDKVHVLGTPEELQSFKETQSDR